MQFLIFNNITEKLPTKKFLTHLIIQILLCQSKYNIILAVVYFDVALPEMRHSQFNQKGTFKYRDSSVSAVFGSPANRTFGKTAQIGD